MNLNRVILAGNLTRDVELRHTQGNTAIASVGLAVNRKWRDQSGQTQEEATFIDCEAWGRTAEVMQQYLRKGSRVLIEGRLKLDQWKDKDGASRSRIKVVVESMQLVDRPSDANDGGHRVASGHAPRQSASATAGKTSRYADGAGYSPVSEEEIPF